MPAGSSYSCSHPGVPRSGAVPVFHDLVESMNEWMVKVSTALDVREAIKQALLLWKHGECSSVPDLGRMGFVEAFRTKKVLGCKPF